MSRSVDTSEQQSAPPAEQPRGEEQEVAAGRVASTPFAMITWVGVVLGALALVALVLVVVAYVLA